ncbi:siphovirus Gp157 family protein [Cycloclasticus pugetii]|uniref:siphovirus Gp157 family protein n=1 Tax=Cycloclasticus pugetii TaxID=34068 RepID=UPI002409BA59|nr:siphovirus Gp157 family protein [Cycloclasticus pugetii]MDF1830644.1 siphovirus Gp157 family protein [Cycloclasticus pugetii]
MNLYQLNDCMKQAEDALNDGATPEEVAEVIAAIEMDFKQKAVNIAYFMRNLSGFVESVKSEEVRLSTRRKQYEAHIDRMKNYLSDGMKESGITKADDGVISVSYGKPKPLLVIDDESCIPEKYLAIKVISSVDKKALLNDLKIGEEVKGASIGESKPSITIK